MIVSIPERGAADIGSEDWAALRGDDRFWRLVDDKIVFVDEVSRKRKRLRGSCYVGRAVVGSRIVEVNEKFPGALEALVSHGAISGPRIERVPSPITPTSRSTAVLVTTFLRAVKTYLSNWKVSRYNRVPQEGTLIGGRLDIVGTAALRARGLVHKAAFDRTVLSADVPLNRCVYGALREIERLTRLVEIPSDQVARARALRLGLSECLPSVLKARSGELASTASKYAEDRTIRADARDVASLAGAVLDAAGFGGTEASTRTVARSWFVNLETLFEHTVRRLVGAVLEGLATVTGPVNRPSVFKPDRGRYRANPDVVIRRDGVVIAVADAKYKNFTGPPATSDVYEILAHASAYEAANAMLFYPVERKADVLDFGVSTTGCRLLAIGVSFNDTFADIGEGLERAGIRVRHRQDSSKRSAVSVRVSGGESHSV